MAIRALWIGSSERASSCASRSKPSAPPDERKSSERMIESGGREAAVD